MPVVSRGQSSAAGVAAALVAVLLPFRAGAEQMVLFDITYEHTAANDSHHGVGGATLKQPDNWTTPINYAAGTIYFYQEISTKPSDRNTIIDFCFISSGGYGCIETIHYTKAGVVETMRGMAPGGHWHQRNQINFTRRINSIQLVLKDPETYTNGGNPKSAFLPSKMRFVATLVSPGGTYVKPTPSPGFSPGDAGAPTPEADASAPTTSPDAGPVATPDAGSSPPVMADAAATPTPTPPRPDAAVKPPTMTPPPGEDPDPAPAPGARKAAGGCTVAGGAASGGSAMVLVAVLGLVLLSLLRTFRTATVPRKRRKIVACD